MEREDIACSLAAQSRNERELSVEPGSQVDELDLEENECAPDQVTTHTDAPHEGGASHAIQMTTFSLVVKLVSAVFANKTKQLKRRKNDSTALLAVQS